MDCAALNRDQSLCNRIQRIRDENLCGVAGRVRIAVGGELDALFGQIRVKGFLRARYPDQDLGGGVPSAQVEDVGSRSRRGKGETRHAVITGGKVHVADQRVDGGIFTGIVFFPSNLLKSGKQVLGGARIPVPIHR